MFPKVAEPSGPVRTLRRIMAPITRTRPFRRSAPHWMPVAEKVTSTITGGRLQVSGILVPSLVLHSIGAKSGEPRDSVLMYTPHPDGGAIIAGTSFARDRHPAWSYNLLAHPDVTVSVRGKTFPVRAARIPDEKREETWRIIEAQWPGYRGYERESGRTVRLFRLHEG